MKLRLNKEDILSLTDEQKEKLRELWEPKKYDVFMEEYPDGTINIGVIDRESYIPSEHAIPLFSIGDLIEILGDKLNGISTSYNNGGVDVFLYNRESIGNKELCDALFQALKEVL